MSNPYSYGSQPNVQGWLDGQYEYMVPDKDMDKPTGKPSSKPRDAYRDYTPELSDETVSRGQDHRSSREKYHSSAKERYTPLSPPSEYDLDRERDKHRRASGRSHRRDRDYEVDQEERRPRHDRDTRYPPKADHGRRHRPPLTTATTSPYLTAGQPTKGEDAGKPRHRRYSQGSSSPRHLDDQASRSHHSRRHGARSPSPPPPRRTSKKKDSRDRDDQRRRRRGRGRRLGIRLGGMRLVMWVGGVVLGEGITSVQYTEYAGITGEQEQEHQFGGMFLSRKTGRYLPSGSGL